MMKPQGKLNTKVSCCFCKVKFRKLQFLQINLLEIKACPNPTKKTHLIPLRNQNVAKMMTNPVTNTRVGCAFQNFAGRDYSASICEQSTKVFANFNVKFAKTSTKARDFWTLT